MTTPDLLAPAKKVLVDPHPAWGGIVVGISAAVIFVIFATWIVVQRLKHGKDERND